MGRRVRDLRAAGAPSPRLGTREIPDEEQSHLRYPTFGHTWLALSRRYADAYHGLENERFVGRDLDDCELACERSHDSYCG